MRSAKVERNTKETRIKLELNLDGSGEGVILVSFVLRSTFALLMGILYQINPAFCRVSSVRPVRTDAFATYLPTMSPSRFT